MLRRKLLFPLTFAFGVDTFVHANQSCWEFRKSLFQNIDTWLKWSVNHGFPLSFKILRFRMILPHFSGFTPSFGRSENQLISSGLQSLFVRGSQNVGLGPAGPVSSGKWLATGIFGTGPDSLCQKLWVETWGCAEVCSYLLVGREVFRNFAGHLWNVVITQK